MQNPTIMAFRKRLKKRGYDDVKIKLVRPKTKVNGCWLYSVSAIDPLTRNVVKADYTIIGMDNSFRFRNGGGCPCREVPDTTDYFDDNQITLEFDVS